MQKQRKTITKSTPRNRRVIKRERSKLEGFKFIPAIAIAVFATFLSLQPHSSLPGSRSVLAYATNTSQAGLLSSTNAQRSNNSVGGLTSNNSLISAAQAKANDMATRGYWSHNTPDGLEPWVFFNNAGYQYSAAGENLAYGYLTSDSTVLGWMNSPPHKANLINGTFTEVGFGIANTSDYCYLGDHDSNVNTANTNQCFGPQTIVVAMYGKPLNAVAPPAPSAAPTTPSGNSDSQAVKNSQAQPVTTIEVDTPVESQEPVAAAPIEKISDTTLVTSEANIVASPSTTQRLQLLTGGNTFLSVGLLTISVLAVGVFWLIHKGIHLKKYIIAGENYFIHHIHIDLTVLAFIYLGFVLLSSSGVVR